MSTISNRIMKRTSTLALAGVILAAAAALGFSQKLEIGTNAPAGPVRLSIDNRPVERSGKFTTSFAPVVKKVAPSVVKVSTTSKVDTSMGDPSQFDDSFLRRFFGDQMPGRGFHHNAPSMRQHGVGSGVIVSEDGYILTNNHVVDGAQDLKVTLTDGREFTAKVIGRDPKTDLAVIKISAKGLPAIEVADSEKIEVGDLVLAVGNPFGIGQTVTMGMVSAKGRGNMGLDYEDFIQTDAAINPGNSGGALVDAEGRLVGINTMILSRSGGSQGIGFAIPSSMARYVMDGLVTNGHITRGYLGVYIQDISPALASEFKLKEGQGALVSDVTPKSPAEKAGLKSGDVVTEFQGKAVRDSRQLKLEVAETKPGSKVTLKVLRDGSPVTLQPVLQTLPGEEQLAKGASPSAEDNGTLNGVTVSDIDGRARQELDIPEHLHGAVVTEVEPDSAASEAGLKPGDVILEINRHPVKTADEAVRLTENPKDKKTLLRIWSKGASHYVVVDEEKAG